MASPTSSMPLWPLSIVKSSGVPHNSDKVDSTVFHFRAKFDMKFPLIEGLLYIIARSRLVYTHKC